jgi:hypothetical protein
LKKKLIEGERVHVIDDEQIVIDEESQPALPPPPPKDEFSIDDPEEVDPFDNPSRSSKGRRSTFQKNKPQSAQIRQE